MKKAQISSQFNWIFILIIGAIILTFFLSIVNKQKSVAETKISMNVVMSIKTLLKSAMVKDKAVQFIKMPRQEFEFYCLKDTCTEQGCYSGYRVKGQPIDVSSDQMVIFSPRNIGGKKLILYSYSFDYPFHIDNLLYVTTDQVRYILVNDSSELAETVKELMPDNITLDVVSEKELNDIKDENFYNVRYIFFDEEPNIILNSKKGKFKKNVTAVSLSFSEKPFGTAKYYYVDFDGVVQEIGEVSFFDNSTLLGTIFSQDPEIYTCNLIKELGHFKRLVEIYGYKVNILQQSYSKSSDCGAVNYDMSLFESIVTAVSSFISRKDFSIIADLSKYVTKLKSINKYARDFSCPVIY